MLASWRSMTNIAGSGSIGQRHGSADPDSHQKKGHGSGPLKKYKSLRKTKALKRKNCRDFNNSYVWHTRQTCLVHTFRNPGNNRDNKDPEYSKPPRLSQTNLRVEHQMRIEKWFGLVACPIFKTLGGGPPPSTVWWGAPLAGTKVGARGEDSTTYLTVPEKRLSFWGS